MGAGKGPTMTMVRHGAAARRLPQPAARGTARYTEILEIMVDAEIDRVIAGGDGGRQYVFFIGGVDIQIRALR